MNDTAKTKSEIERQEIMNKTAQFLNAGGKVKQLDEDGINQTEISEIALDLRSYFDEIDVDHEQQKAIFRYKRLPLEDSEAVDKNLIKIIDGYSLKYDFEYSYFSDFRSLTFELKPKTIAWKLFGKVNSVRMRFRHRYECNREYIETLEKHGLVFSG